MLAIRDRALYGGSYHGNVALTAYQAYSLLPEVGLYSPSVVKELQQMYEWTPMTPDLHAEELLMVVYEAWRRKRPEWFEMRDWFVGFGDTVFGKELRILAPVVRYGESSVTPRWLSGPKPYRSDEEVRFAGDALEGKIG